MKYLTKVIGTCEVNNNGRTERWEASTAFVRRKPLTLKGAERLARKQHPTFVGHSIQRSTYTH